MQAPEITSDSGMQVAMMYLATAVRA